jgi:diguanylate cyclase (GGDEF)-like protein
VGWIVEKVQPLRVADAEKDPRFVERPDRKGRIASLLGVPIVSGNICLGVISAVHEETGYFTPEHEEILTLLACMCGPYVEMRRYAHVASVDPLTSALTRNGLDVALPETRLSKSGDLPIAVVMVDIDNFKQINNMYGHVVGDQVLKEVARALAGIMGSGDAVVRYGGEEFLMILPGVHLSAAGKMAEDARRTIQTSSFDFRSIHVPVTASFGVAERRMKETRSDLIMRADGAMQAAKKAGRNKVVLAE